MDYVISDLHLDHRNIIDYCDRPFESVDEMNERLVANWNDVVDPGDEVLFCGDLTVSSNPADLLDWLDRLEGEVVFVLGNHDGVQFDRLDGVHFFEHYRFQHGDHDFYAVHDPERAPRNHSGWVLHGHHHNNWPDRFPFVNPAERLVNCSVELLDYRPLSMDRLVSLLESERRYADLAAAE